jgi:hypothetical protein
MFHEDGTMKKFCKSDLVQQFEKEVSPVLSLPDFDPSLTTYIRDGMALVQCMDAKKHRTFEWNMDTEIGPTGCEECCQS